MTQARVGRWGAGRSTAPRRPRVDTISDKRFQATKNVFNSSSVDNGFDDQGCGEEQITVPVEPAPSKAMAPFPPPGAKDNIEALPLMVAPAPAKAEGSDGEQPSLPSAKVGNQ